MAKDNGGQAFPSKQLGNTDGIPFEYSNEGMTLRDYFAGQVLMGILANPLTKDFQKHSCSIASKISYEVADAMLAERTK